MKKFFASVLTMALLMPLSITSAAQANDGTIANSELNTFSVENLSKEIDVAESQTLEASKVNQTNFKIASIATEGSNISLQGTLDDDTSINLNGILKRTYASPDKIIVGALTDPNQKYEVIHFSINRSLDEFVSVVDQVQETPTLNLYLKEIGTRNFTFIETSIPSSFNLDEVFNRVNTFEEFDSAELLWFKKVLEPSSVSEEEVIPTNNGMSIQANDIKSSTSRKNYALSYNWAGSSFTDFVVIDHILSWPVANPERKITGTAQIVSSHTWDYTTNKRVAEGGTADVKNLSTSYGLTSGTIRDLNVGGRYSTGTNNIKIELSVSASTFIPGVGFNIKYDPVRTETVYPVPVNKPSIKFKVDPGLYLFQPGQNMYSVIEANHKGPTKLYVRFQYEMLNGIVTLPGESNMSLSF